MTKNKHNRVTKLEEKSGIKGERRKVIPHCCFYSRKYRECDCVPYWTREPRVIGFSMADLYKEVNSGKCIIPPADAEFITEYFDEKPNDEKETV